MERIERIDDLDTMKGQGLTLQGGLTQTAPVFSTEPGKAPQDDAAAEAQRKAVDEQAAYSHPYDDDEVQLLIMGAEAKAQLEKAQVEQRQEDAPPEQEAPVPKEQEAVDEVTSQASSWSMASEEHGKLTTEKAPAVGGSYRGASQPLSSGRKRKDGTPVDLFGGFQEVDTLDNVEARENKQPRSQDLDELVAQDLEKDPQQRDAREMHPKNLSRGKV